MVIVFPAPANSSLISTRAQRALPSEGARSIWEWSRDAWNPATNPDGLVCLGLAENALMHQRLLLRLLRNLQLPSSALTYGDGTSGTGRLKSVIARLLNRRFNPVIPVTPDQILVTNGCSAAIEHLTWATADAGEGLLLGRPYFRAFIKFAELRVCGEVIEVAFGDVDPFSVEAVQKYEEALLLARQNGTNVRALILCNPHNPLGQCYSKNTIIKFMQLCQKYQMHLISDEIYALSIWGDGVPFRSCLSIDTTNIIDPSLVHVTWGLSKDFGANGIRIGAIISQSNPNLLRAVDVPSIHSMSSSLAEYAMADILEDDEWVDSYISENHSLILKHYNIVQHWAEANDIIIRERVNAAFFVWINLGQAYRNRHPEYKADQHIEKKLMDQLLKQKVLLIAGSDCGSEEGGWFRMVFTVQQYTLEEGLSRVLISLEHKI